MDIVGILEKIGFNFQVFIFNLVNFLLVAFLLQKFFFKKVIATLDERKKIIKEGILNAEKAHQDLIEANETKAQIISDAKNEANEIVGSAVSQAKLEAEKVKNSTVLELDEIKEKSMKEIESERKSMFEEFKSEASDLVMLATEKLLSDKMHINNISKATASEVLEEIAAEKDNS